MLRVPAAIPLLAILAGCHSAPRPPSELRHHAGERLTTVRVHHGEPILQKVFFWDGNAEEPSYGAGLSNLWFTSDDWAFGAELAATLFKPDRREVYAGEVDGLIRTYLYNEKNLGIFFGGGGGYIRSDKPFPDGGTLGNFTFQFGPGAELPIGENTELLLGIDFHHVSNALGRESLRNPSQNEARFWIGMGFTW